MTRTHAAVATPAATSALHSAPVARTAVVVTDRVAVAPIVAAAVGGDLALAAWASAGHITVHFGNGVVVNGNLDLGPVDNIGSGNAGTGREYGEKSERCLHFDRSRWIFVGFWVGSRRERTDEDVKS